MHHAAAISRRRAACPAEVAKGPAVITGARYQGRRESPRLTLCFGCGACTRSDDQLTSRLRGHLDESPTPEQLAEIRAVLDAARSYPKGRQVRGETDNEKGAHWEK